MSRYKSVLKALPFTTYAYFANVPYIYLKYQRSWFPTVLYQLGRKWEGLEHDAVVIDRGTIIMNRVHFHLLDHGLNSYLLISLMCSLLSCFVRCYHDIIPELRLCRFSRKTFVFVRFLGNYAKLTNCKRRCCFFSLEFYIWSILVLELSLFSCTWSHSFILFGFEVRVLYLICFFIVNTVDFSVFYIQIKDLLLWSP